MIKIGKISLQIKSAILILFFITSVITLLLHKRYNYITKDRDKLYVTVKGHDYNWNKEFYDTFLKKLYPNKKEIVIKKISNPDILLVSHFFNWAA